MILACQSYRGKHNTSQLYGLFICDKVMKMTQHRKGKFLNKVSWGN